MNGSRLLSPRRAQGGLLALYAGAVDPRIHTTAVLGYFGSRESLWREPIYRNVSGLLREFGDAELALLVDKQAESGKKGRQLFAPGQEKMPAGRRRYQDPDV